MKIVFKTHISETFFGKALYSELLIKFQNSELSILSELRSLSTIMNNTKSFARSEISIVKIKKTLLSTSLAPANSQKDKRIWSTRAKKIAGGKQALVTVLHSQKYERFKFNTVAIDVNDFRRNRNSDEIYGNSEI